jgi:3D (Asp-Asp-Asp) domain-containing protein
VFVWAACQFALQGCSTGTFEEAAEDDEAPVDSDESRVQARFEPIEVYWAREASGAYKLHALASAATVRVEYFVDGFKVGAATRSDGQNFPARYTFSVERAERQFEVRGFDAANAQVSRGVGLLDVTAQTAVYIRQLGATLFDVGLERAPSSVAAIEVRVDEGAPLRDSVSGKTRSDRNAVRATLASPGKRSFRITTYNADGSVRGHLSRTFTVPAAPSSTPEPRPSPPPSDAGANVSPGTPAGRFKITYYWKALESEFSGAANTAIKDTSCRTIKMVPAAYAQSLCIEGSGKLNDGRIVNYGQSCSCNPGCSYCYTVVDASRFPWGIGNRNNPLVPLRSLAVDTSVVRNGTRIYLKAFDGLRIPAVDGIGGFVHDGCFRADDVGGAIRGQHFDVFSGTPGMRRELERVLPTNSRLETWVDANARCAHLR